MENRLATRNQVPLTLLDKRTLLTVRSLSELFDVVFIDF